MKSIECKLREYEKQLAIGKKVEKEHNDLTDGDIRQTKKIIEAHLKEDPKYYSKLQKAKL